MTMQTGRGNWKILCGKGIIGKCICHVTTIWPADGDLSVKVVRMAASFIGRKCHVRPSGGVVFCTSDIIARISARLQLSPDCFIRVFPRVIVHTPKIR